MIRQIYLDHNATAPMLPEAMEALANCLETVGGNPASQHSTGRAARRVLEDARDGMAELLGLNLAGQDPDRLILTSGGTEANNLAIRGLARGPAGRIATSAIEHPCVTAPARELERQGWTVDLLPVGADGAVRIEEFEKILTGETRLVSVMHANHETGVIQPVQQIAATCHARGALFHTDASQTIGKLPFNFCEIGADAATVSAHKFHGPVGIGALIVRGGVQVSPILHGGEHQGGLRPGTQGVAFAVGMHVALRDACVKMTDRAARLRNLRDEFEALLQAADARIVIHGQGSERLGHVTNVAFPGVDRQAMLMTLDRRGLQCSTGAACASGSTNPSPTLLAMGVDRGLVDGSLRFSFGELNRDDEAGMAAALILEEYRRLQGAGDRGKTGSGQSR